MFLDLLVDSCRSVFSDHDGGLEKIDFGSMRNDQ